jgi:predicted RNase H-like HicB family nuclease
MRLTRDEYLAIPYVLVVESIEQEDGDWRRQASYPELPDAVAVADSPIDAMEEVDRKREKIILERLAEGEEIPVPRPPL